MFADLAHRSIGTARGRAGTFSPAKHAAANVPSCSGQSLGIKCGKLGDRFTHWMVWSVLQTMAHMFGPISQYRQAAADNDAPNSPAILWMRSSDGVAPF